MSKALETGIFDAVSVGTPDTRNSLLLSMQEDYLSGNISETFSITLLNPFFDDSQFIANKIDNIFDQRDNLDADPLIQEIKDIPRTLDKIDDLRARIIPGSGDILLIEWTIERRSDEKFTNKNKRGGDSEDTYAEYDMNRI